MFSFPSEQAGAPIIPLTHNLGNVCADGGSELADSVLSGRPLKSVPKPLEYFSGSGHLGLPSEAVLQPRSVLFIQISGPERKRLHDH